MQFWIFSYNRGEFLKNCVASIEYCAPQCGINIFDDNSTDPLTRDILANLSVHHSIHYPPASDAVAGKHGGLYGNMQTALERVGQEDIICFVQDDMQLVRPINDDELQRIERHFAEHPSVGFLRPTFLKGCNRDKDRPLTRFSESENVYFVDRFKNSAGAHYSDVFIASAQKLKAVNWNFLPKESLNEQQARKHFAQMPQLRDPFLAYLPLVPAYRGKQQTLALRWAHKHRACGFYPLRIMSADESRQFLARNAQTSLPYAEDFLKTEGVKVPEPWIYYPLQGSGLLKQLDRIERRISHLRAR